MCFDVKETIKEYCFNTYGVYPRSLIPVQFGYTVESLNRLTTINKSFYFGNMTIITAGAVKLVNLIFYHYNPVSYQGKLVHGLFNNNNTKLYSPVNDLTDTKICDFPTQKYIRVSTGFNSILLKNLAFDNINVYHMYKWFFSGYYVIVY